MEHREKLEKHAQLDALEGQLLASGITPDLATQATRLVFGDGNPDADIVLIGEAPGKNEDLSGVPFVGAAGKFLDEMLASIALDRKDIYITNIVKYRPPDNRDPLPEEKLAFWPYLLRQMAIIQPRVIVTLGRHSGQAFIEDLRISVDHGKPRRVTVTSGVDESTAETWTVLPLYHPAAALYNGSLRQTLLDDFQTVTNFISNT